MIRSLRTALYTAFATVLLVLGGAGTAFGRPQPIEPDFAPPAGPSPLPPDPGVSDATWLLMGVGVALALAAVAVMLLVWRRAHVAGPRVVTP